MSPVADGHRHDAAWPTTGLLFAASSLLCAGTALWLERHGAFAHIDTLFNADAPWYIRGFTDGHGTGTSWGPRSFVHPNLANVVYPIVSFLSRVSNWLGLGTGDPTAVRHAIGLGVCPLVAGAETAAIYRLLRPVVPNPALMAGVHMVFFSTLLFGAVPESFAFTGLGLALLFWCLEAERRVGKPATVRLALVCAFVTSVTITNIVLFVIAVGIHRWARAPSGPSIRDTAVAAVSGVMITAAMVGVSVILQDGLRDYVPTFEQLHEAPLLRTIASGEAKSANSLVTQARTYTRRARVDFPEALAYALIPPSPAVVMTTRPGDSPVAVTYQGTPPDWRRILTVLVLIGLAGLAAIRRSDSQPLYLAAFSLLGYSWLFHTIFGAELMLYSKHWTLATTIVLSGLPAYLGPLPRKMMTAVVLMAIAGNSLYVLLWMVHRLPG
ncbi:MAG TPA: hypothetical protein VMZ90_01155 [Vicinamibacterales bacterium]|nr:hypothetical protein [Vicinamibacterales bacterium]